MSGCGQMMDVTIPTRYSAKVVRARCGSTSIYGDMNLCDKCVAAGIPNPPSYTYEDAGDADFQPYREDMDYD